MPFDNPENTAGNFAGVPIERDTVVYDASGEKVGTVHDYNTDGGYVVVEKGWLFPKDLYIPTSAFSRMNANGAYLSVNKGDIPSMNWDNPPTTSRSAGMPANAAAYGMTGSAYPAPAEEGDVAVPVHEEELRASKSSSEQGRVRIHKDVVEEPQTITIPVSHEEVRIERVASQDATAEPGAEAFQEKDIEVPLRGEEVHLSKETHKEGEVRLHKRDVTEQERLSDTVRRERVDVEGLDADETMPYTEGSDLSERRPDIP